MITTEILKGKRVALLGEISDFELKREQARQSRDWVNYGSYCQKLFDCARMLIATERKLSGETPEN